MPIFNSINVEGLDKNDIIENLKKENLDSFRYQDNIGNGDNDNDNNRNNTNNNGDVNQSNLTDINNNEANKNGLLNPNRKKRSLCGC